MSDDANPLEGFAGVARLFPLPNLVLFPHVMQPLHIFEPRYRQMTADALEGDRLITMSLLRPGWENDYAKNPEIHPVACIGKIVAEQKLADGRYNILLRGLSRVQIQAEKPQVQLYRKADVELLVEAEVDDPVLEKELRKHLKKQAPHWFGDQKAVLDQIRKLFRSDLPFGMLVDILAFTLPLDVEMKQAMLEELDVEKRARLLIQQLDCKKSVPASAGRTFPPDFSVN